MNYSSSTSLLDQVNQCSKIKVEIYNDFIYDFFEQTWVTTEILSKVSPVTADYYGEYTDETIGDLGGYLNRYAFRITDQTGIIFQHQSTQFTPGSVLIGNPIRTTVFDLGNPCTEYELLCESEYYPGWECVPYEKISRELQEIDRALRGR